MPAVRRCTRAVGACGMCRGRVHAEASSSVHMGGPCACSQPPSRPADSGRPSPQADRQPPLPCATACALAWAKACRTASTSMPSTCTASRGGSGRAAGGRRVSRQRASTFNLSQTHPRCTPSRRQATATQHAAVPLLAAPSLPPSLPPALPPPPLHAGHVVSAGVVGRGLGGTPLSSAHACSTHRAAHTHVSSPLPAGGVQPLWLGSLQHQGMHASMLTQHSTAVPACPLPRHPAARPARPPPPLTVVVVFADKDAGQVPQRGDVEGLEDLALHRQAPQAGRHHRQAGTTGRQAG